MMTGNQTLVVGSVLAVGFALGLIVIGMAGCPVYNVWQQKKSGEAELRKQEYAKKVFVEQARAELESSKLLAEAEVERAKGIAESMKIISGQLKDNEEYLQYWAIQAQIKMAASPNHTQIYIPSGANGIPLIKSIE